MNDRFAIGGKLSKPREHAQLLVVGAGAAGVAAAIEGAQAGLSVVLVDENPVSAGLMGLDVPLFYGQRMTAAVQEEGRMVERLVASSPALEAAYDAGVDVRLGVTVWGAFVNGPAVRALPGRVAGLADADTSWLCGFDALILATGARDLVLGFAGVDTPGVMGVRALEPPNALIARVAVMPSMTGICTSMKMTSLCPSARRSTASAPLAAMVTSQPKRSRTLRITSWLTALSSATSTLRPATLIRCCDQ